MVQFNVKFRANKYESVVVRFNVKFRANKNESLVVQCDCSSIVMPRSVCYGYNNEYVILLNILFCCLAGVTDRVYIYIYTHTYT